MLSDLLCLDVKNQLIKVGWRYGSSETRVGSTVKLVDLGWLEKMSQLIEVGTSE